jgi:flagellar export protein FliJ
MDVIRHKIDHLLNTKENKILELIEKSKEHEIINTLDEKHHEQFVHEQNKRDIISMDEIAANRFNSGRKN